MNPNEVYCRTCRLALNVYQGPAGPTYRHSAELRGQTVDHPADPVPLAELPDAVRMCDVCSGLDVAFVYAGADQSTEQRRITTVTVDIGEYRNRHGAARARRVDTEAVQAHNWGERWTVCPACAEHIEARNILGLIERGTRNLPAKLTRGKRLVLVRGELHGVYSHLLDTLTPGRWRLIPEPPYEAWEPATTDDTL